jgi:hypothetical protein
MPDKKLFLVYNNTTSNTIQVDLTQDLNLTKLTLIQYQIDGVPVTGGVPDNLFYNLNFTNTSCAMNNPIRNDSVTGFPLTLTGTFTEKSLETGWEVINHPTKLGKFVVEVTKPDKSAAVLSRFSFLFVADLA